MPNVIPQVAKCGKMHIAQRNLMSRAKAQPLEVCVDSVEYYLLTRVTTAYGTTARMMGAFLRLLPQHSIQHLADTSQMMG
jgi:hypothetical protein